MYNFIHGFSFYFVIAVVFFWLTFWFGKKTDYYKEEKDETLKWIYAILHGICWAAMWFFFFWAVHNTVLWPMIVNLVKGLF